MNLSLFLEVCIREGKSSETLSFFLEFCLWILVFSEGGVKKNLGQIFKKQQGNLHASEGCKQSNAGGLDYLLNDHWYAWKNLDFTQSKSEAYLDICQIGFYWRYGHHNAEFAEKLTQNFAEKKVSMFFFKNIQPYGLRAKARQF